MNSNIKDQIKYDDFEKLDIRIGTVVQCEQVQKSEKLLKLEVDFGPLGNRQILTGMAKWYTPEDFINNQFLFLVNLEPRKMMGLESQGMLLSGGLDHDQKPTLISPIEQCNNGDGIC